MRVAECMTTDVQTIGPDGTLQQAARAMAGIDVGALPVAENDRLVGMITDRDICVRGIARGMGPGAKVSEVMSPKVRYCFDDQDLGEVARNMGELQIRRLPVIDRDKRLVGILSLGDLAKGREHIAAAALCEISQPETTASPRWD